MSWVSLYLEPLVVGATRDSQHSVQENHLVILSCAQLIVYFVGSLLSGRIADWLGYGALFSAATVLSLIATLATMRILAAKPVSSTPRGPS